VILAGAALVIDGDDIDTDRLYPGALLALEDPLAMREHLFDGIDPSLRDHLDRDTILIVGDNFGTGSSREHVQLALRAWGVRCLVGAGFARVFARTCVNQGIAPVTCAPAAREARTGAPVRVDLDAGLVTAGAGTHRFAPFGGEIRSILAAGGLVEHARRHLNEKETA
jgi:3-isopropylmalate/(R)-2-methylmalate dehydratase small subunit